MAWKFFRGSCRTFHVSGNTILLPLPPSFSFPIDYVWGKSLQYHLILLEIRSIWCCKGKSVFLVLPSRGKALFQDTWICSAAPNKRFFSPFQVEVGTQGTGRHLGTKPPTAPERHIVPSPESPALGFNATLRPSPRNWAFIYIQYKQLIVYVHPDSSWSVNAELCRKAQRVLGHLGAVLTHDSREACREEEEPGLGIQ